MKRFIISESEKHSILNMHKSRILQEQQGIQNTPAEMKEQGGQAQAMIEKMQAESQATLAGIKGKAFNGKGDASGRKLDIKSVKAIGNFEKASLDVVLNFGGTSDVYIAIVTQADPKSPNGVKSGIGYYAGSPLMDPTPQNIMTIMSTTSWVKNLFNFGGKESQEALAAISTGLQNLINKYSTTGLAAESKIEEVVRKVLREQGGQAQAMVQQMQKDTQATLAGAVGKKIAGAGKAAGATFPIKSVSASSNPEKGLITAQFNVGGSSTLYVDIYTVEDAKNPKGVRSGVGPAAEAVNYANVVKYMKYSFSKDLINFNSKDTMDAITAITAGVQSLVTKYSTTGIATESIVKEIVRRVLNEQGGQSNPAMDKMIADTQALAQGAVGATFTDGTSEPMKVGSASVVANEPEKWRLNGAIALRMTTNFGGIAKSIKIGLLSDATGTVKIVGPGGQLLPLDAIGIKSALQNWLGTAYQKMLDKSTAANPSPYKQLLPVLTGIAEKYKSTGLAAPTK